MLMAHTDVKMEPESDMRPKGSPWKDVHPRFFPAMIVMFILLQLLFLGNMCYLYATQFRSNARFHNFNLLYVDYDGGVIGKSVLDAYQRLRGDEFPTLQPEPSTEYPHVEDVREAVCRGEYWGAIYTSPGGSNGLASALESGARPPTSLIYIWNGVRYPAFSQAAIYSSLLQLVETTRSTYYANNGSSVVASADLSDPNILAAFLSPIRAQEINIKGTQQGTRVFYNTVSMVMPIIQQFFFIMTLNGISSSFGAFTKLSWKINYLIRAIVSVLYTFIGSLLMTGYIWGYRESWAQSVGRFVLTWMILWLLMHINFLIFDIATAFIPIQFMPFLVLTWVIFNISSTVSPFEMNPGFFRWGYALPSHEAYQVLIQIWSGGCNNRLYQALPIMFSWWIVGLPAAVYAMKYRCKSAVAARGALDRARSEDFAEVKRDGRSDGVGTVGGSERDIQQTEGSAGALPPRHLS